MSHDILEVLDEPPSLSDLLSTPALRTIYKWHMISLYCPENLLFREAVEKYKKLWEKGASPNQQLVSSRCKGIVSGFCSPDSVMEINMLAKEKNQLMESIKNPDEHTFDALLYNVDKDIGRSLQGFWVTEIFLAYYEHKKLLDDIVENGSEPPARSDKSTIRNRAGTIGYTDDRDDVLALVRSAFGTEEPIVLTRQFDIASAYHYKITVQTDTANQVGWGIQRGPHFFFYNMDEEQILKVFAATLLGKGSGKPAKTKGAEAPQPDVDTDVAQSSGCCGGSAAAPVQNQVEAVAPMSNDWYVKNSKGVEAGPIPTKTVELWWKYHLIFPHTIIRCGAGDYKTVEDYDLFDSMKQIETMDPTQVSTF